MAEALKAADILAVEGIRATVVNCRFLKPHDGEILQEVVSRHQNVITLEEGAVLNGFGAYIVREINCLDVEHQVHVRCLGIPDRFVEHGARDILLREAGLDSEKIIAETKIMLGDIAYSPSAETA